MKPALRLELGRKAIQALGLAFVPFGRIGAMALLSLAAVDVLHLKRHSRGGLPLWRRVRRVGERSSQRDIGPLFLALGAAPVLFLVRGPWAWAILAQPFLADSSAALIGHWAGGPLVPGTGKTMAGSASFFAVAALFALMVGLSLPASLLLAGLGMIAEAYAPCGLDNLLVPLAGLSLWYLLL